MLKGFRDFIMRGNVIDLAVAFVIGAAFGAVISSFVDHILMPLLGLLGLPDMSQLAITTPGGAVIYYGLFINALVTFVAVAAAIYFFVVKPVERMRTTAETTTKTCPQCASEIPLAARRCPMCTSELPA
jgi:large conductance mechanosensitive channel